MGGFSIQDVALSGFAAVRSHPRALLVWTPLAFAASIILQLVTLRFIGGDVDLSSLMADPAALQAFAAKTLPGDLAVGAIALVFNAIAQVAMIRLVLHPQDDRFGYVRLGADELRQLALSVLAFIVIEAALVITGLGVAMVGGLVSMAVGALRGPLILLDLAISLTVVVFLAVRLCLAPAITFERKRIDLFGSWPMSRDHFWRILSAYILVVTLIAAVYVFAIALMFGLGGLALGAQMMAEITRPAASVADVFEPLRLIMTLFSAFLTALLWPVLLTPCPAIFASLSPPAPHGAGAWA
jgi:hypothetical protein